MIIAVDFDGTLCKHKYPNIGREFILRIKSLIRRKELGDKIILWTCRDGKELQEAIDWCKGFGLEFDAVNEDLPEIKQLFINKSCKVYADVYLDDRNVTWEELVV